MHVQLRLWVKVLLDSLDGGFSISHTFCTVGWLVSQKQVDPMYTANVLGSSVFTENMSLSKILKIPIILQIILISDEVNFLVILIIGRRYQIHQKYRYH